MLVEPDRDVQKKGNTLDIIQAVVGTGIEVGVAAASEKFGFWADAVGAAGELALDLTSIFLQKDFDEEEYQNNLAGIDEFFDDPKHQDWGSVNIRDTRTVVEIKDFQVGVDTITLPVLPKGWLWETSTGKFEDGKRAVSLSFKNGTNASGEILRIGFKEDRIGNQIDNPEQLINDLLVRSNSGWAIGKTINRERSTSGTNLNGTVAGDYLSIDDKNNNRIVTLSGGLSDDILIGRLTKNDSLDGGDGNDYFRPGDGNDTILGGEGYDRVDYSNLEQRVRITAANFNDNFQSIEGIVATEFNDDINLSRLRLDKNGINDKDVVGLISLEGIGGNDSLRGSIYDDFIDGGEGIDRMEGFGGDDVYVVDNSSDRVIERANRGTDKVESTIDFSLESLPHIENLTLTGYTTTPRVLVGKGNNNANILKVKDFSSPGLISATFYGNGGNDKISGGAGADFLDGGTGEDSLNGGADGDELYGGADNDTLKGETGIDFLEGGDGNDFLNGGADDDYLFGNAGEDSLNGGADGDELYGGADNDFLVGDFSYSDVGDDTLYGGAGNDILFGIAGNDTLYGGAGDDTLHGNVTRNNSYFGEVIEARADWYSRLRSFNEYPPQVADVNGDGRADIINFGNTKDFFPGVYVNLGRADGKFDGPIAAMNDFTLHTAIGWDSFETNPRQVADVNGDGRADIVAFGYGEVFVALGQENGTFGSLIEAKRDDFTFHDANYGKGWKSFDKNPRLLGDVNGDGRADIVGFANDSVGVSLGQEDGTFGPVSPVIEDDFTVKDRGWSSFDKNPRLLGDVNGDGRADIVAFGNDAVYTALGQADGTFAASIEAKNDDFTVNDANYGRGWSSFDEYPRQLGDVNGDGRADIVGFAHDSVGFALGQEDGTFSPVILAKDSDFTFNDGNFSIGWKSFDENPRQVADVNGDGHADIIGFTNLTVQVSLAIYSQEDVLTGGEGADTFVIDTSDLSGRSYDVITDFSHAEGDKIQIGSEFQILGATSSDQFSYDSGNGELSFDDTHVATLNTDSDFDISEDIVF